LLLARPAYDASVPGDLTPFPRPRQDLIRETKRPGQVASRVHVPRRVRILFGGWCAALFGLSLAFTLAIVHRAVSNGAPRLPGHYLVGWGVAAGASFLIVAVLGGLVVFPSRTPWHVALLWPLVSGPAVATGYFFGLTGQMESGSTLCDASASGSCDTAWGLGAVVVAIASAIVLGTLFAAAFTTKRLATRIRLR
jgi:hypothetical protein